MVGIEGIKVQVFHSNKSLILLVRDEMKSNILEINLGHKEWVTQLKKLKTDKI